MSDPELHYISFDALTSPKAPRVDANSRRMLQLDPSGWRTTSGSKMRLPWASKAAAVVELLKMKELARIE